MKNKSNKLLTTSLHGMDGRTYKTMRMFLQGTCKGIVDVVEEHEADIDIIDVDLMTAQVSLDHCMARVPLRPIIVLSLKPVNIENTIYVKKPVTMESMVLAFKEARSWLQKQEKNQQKQATQIIRDDKEAESDSKANLQSQETVVAKEDIHINLADQIAVSLHGMDEQAHQTMLSFIREDCKGIAQVVKEHEADIDIIDADLMDARISLDHCLARKPLRPIILLSLETLNLENTIYVKKPVIKEDMLAALKQANSSLGKAEKLKAIKDSAKKEAMIATFKEASNWEEKKKERGSPLSVDIESNAKDQKHKVENLAAEKKTYVKSIEQQKTAKHQAAMMINEKNFSNFIGIVSDVDFADQKQWEMAVYNPKHYYQGYVQSSVKIAYDKAQVLQLSSAWKALILLPKSHEIWQDADDKQLRSFAGVKVKSMPMSSTKIMSIAPVNMAAEGFSNDLGKFQDMDVFLWKLACWTSKGRYINSFNLSTPIYLKQWPNFTRLIITPHAMRISACLISKPRSMMEIIQALKIEPQYVFIFVSAAYAVGILEQMKKQDILTQVEIPEVKKVPKKGLLNRILKKLRA